jgi:hypothetical protein
MQLGTKWNAWLADDQAGSMRISANGRSCASCFDFRTCRDLCRYLPTSAFRIPPDAEMTLAGEFQRNSCGSEQGTATLCGSWGAQRGGLPDYGWRDLATSGASNAREWRALRPS